MAGCFDIQTSPKVDEEAVVEIADYLNPLDSDEEEVLDEMNVRAEDGQAKDPQIDNTPLESTVVYIPVQPELHREESPAEGLFKDEVFEGNTLFEDAGAVGAKSKDDAEAEEMWVNVQYWLLRATAPPAADGTL